VGLLYRVAHALASLELDIRHAKVSTLGHEVIDTFYVVGSQHEKIDSPPRLAVVERTVLDAIESPARDEAIRLQS
jgi:[protein-PII] uridylyltransferase